ncbi:nucleotidyltransferase domain-containing protein [Candidatus Berkelbacteria bacterium]|nr:nucleotidyltransferase domain-containing protein [Candidatus Berkelbacteria bacterium]
MEPKKSDLKIAQQVSREFKNKLGNRLVSVFLYGSRARGKARRDSDIDLFLLRKKRPKFGGREEDIITETTVKYLNSNNLYVSAIPYGIKDYQKNKNYVPVLYWIDKEGIEL